MYFKLGGEAFVYQVPQYTVLFPRSEWGELQPGSRWSTLGSLLEEIGRRLLAMGGFQGPACLPIHSQRGRRPTPRGPLTTLRISLQAG